MCVNSETLSKEVLLFEKVMSYTPKIYPQKYKMQLLRKKVVIIVVSNYRLWKNATSPEYWTIQTVIKPKLQNS